MGMIMGPSSFTAPAPATPKESWPTLDETSGQRDGGSPAPAEDGRQPRAVDPCGDRTCTVCWEDAAPARPPAPAEPVVVVGNRYTVLPGARRQATTGAVGDHIGETVTVESPVDGDGDVYVSFPDGSTGYVLPEYLSSDARPTADEVAALRRELDAAQAIARAAQADASRANARAESYRSDFTLVGEALKSEAEGREWCDEYDSFVDKINSRTSALDLPVRITTFEVTISVDGDWRSERTVTVEADSEADATEKVYDEIRYADFVV